MENLITISEAARRAALPYDAMKRCVQTSGIRFEQRGPRTYVSVEDFERHILPSRYYTIKRAAAWLSVKHRISSSDIERWLTTELGEGATIDRPDLAGLGERAYAAYMNPV